jgi:hypothetical protein
VRRILIAVMLMVTPVVLHAQGGDLERAAERARRALFHHDVGALIAESSTLVIQLPGAEPSAALEPDQAAALLSNFVESGQEVETVVRAARQVGPGRGYVELQRRYRVAGTQNIRVQVLLLGYRRTENGWSLVEFRVVG